SDAYAGPFDALSDGEAFFLGSCSPCDSGTTSMTKASTGSTRVEHIAVPKPKRQSPEGLSPVAISFVSPERGWVVVQFERWKANALGDLLFDTSNGGRTWKRVAIVS